MPTLNLGPIGFVYKGLYDPLRVNKLNYVVKDGEGQLFCCIEPNTGEPLTNSVYWDPWIATDDFINDLTPENTKAYSGFKTQQLHDAQAQAIANLATSAGSIKSSTSPVFNGIPLVLTDMPFTVDIDSSDTNIFSYNDVDNTITFKINAAFNFLSTVEFLSSTSSSRDITFALVNTYDDSIIKTEVTTLNSSPGDTVIMPFNTLLTIGKNGFPLAPVTIKIQALASGTGYALTKFKSILASSPSYNALSGDALHTVFTSAGGISATNVQAALEELDTEKTSSGQVVLLNGNQTKAGVLTFSDIPKGPTATAGDNTTNLANTAFVKAAVDAAGGATGGGVDKVFFLNDQIITTNYTVPAGKNAVTAGDVTIASGITVTISSGSKWSIV